MTETVLLKFEISVTHYLDPNTGEITRKDFDMSCGKTDCGVFLSRAEVANAVADMVDDCL